MAEASGHVEDEETDGGQITQGAKAMGRGLGFILKAKASQRWSHSSFNKAVTPDLQKNHSGWCWEWKVSEHNRKGKSQFAGHFTNRTSLKYFCCGSIHFLL